MYYLLAFLTIFRYNKPLRVPIKKQVLVCKVIRIKCYVEVPSLTCVITHL